jgi:acetate kinase
MQVLVFNAGSSSLKFGVFRLGPGILEVFKGWYERFRNGRCEFLYRRGDENERGVADWDDIEAALKLIPAVLARYGFTLLDAIGHRVVHGGAKFSAPVVLDDRTVEAIKDLRRLPRSIIPPTSKR